MCGLSLPAVLRTVNHILASIFSPPFHWINPNCWFSTFKKSIIPFSASSALETRECKAKAKSVKSQMQCWQPCITPEKVRIFSLHISFQKQFMLRAFERWRGHTNCSVWCGRSSHNVGFLWELRISALTGEQKCLNIPVVWFLVCSRKKRPFLSSWTASKSLSCQVLLPTLRHSHY